MNSPSARRKIAAANWKMNGTLDSKAELTALQELIDSESCDIIICPPNTLINSFAQHIEKTKETRIEIGAQDCHPQDSGAFTGDISAPQLFDCGARFVIIGHSERRAGHGETDALVLQKTQAAWRAGLRPIVCVGETLAERDNGETLAVVARQMTDGLPDGVGDSGVGAGADNLILAYEPVWAIGTGRVPNDDEIAQVHGALRQGLAARFGDSIAARIPILYGGSMNADNAARIGHLPDVDGGLIGGASLKADSFAEIIRQLASG